MSFSARPSFPVLAVLCLALAVFGCKGGTDDHAGRSQGDHDHAGHSHADGDAASTAVIEFTGHVAEIACGECLFEMPGASCDLAVRIDGKTYFVDGAHIDDFGNAHAKDGLCNVIRRARVTGRVEKGRFIATKIEPLTAEGGTEGASGG